MFSRPRYNPCIIIMNFYFISKRGYVTFFFPEVSPFPVTGKFLCQNFYLKIWRPVENMEVMNRLFRNEGGQVCSV